MGEWRGVQRGGGRLSRTSCRLGWIQPHTERGVGMMWTWRQRCAVFLMVGAFLALSPVVVGNVDWGALWTGEMVVEKVTHPEGFSGLRGSFTVAASRERMWAVLV